jgi:hypothetical protein
MTVLILGEDPAAARVIQKQASASLRRREVNVHFRWLLRVTESRLLEILDSERCGVLVLSAASANIAEEHLEKLLEAVECPVMVVR